MKKTLKRLCTGFLALATVVIPVALTWFMSQKTFDGKKPYSFLKSQITYALRPKITYAGKAVKLHKQTLNETITAVRSVNYVPDKIY